MISEIEAQKIASKFIEVDSAMAGTPILKEIRDTMVYIVPVIINDIREGEIYINAETGENIGGAGG